MFKRIYRARFTCSKYVANLLIILFIVRGVASLIESDISGHIGNTTASLRLTRQKVLIQAIQNPEKLGEKRQSREKHAIDKQDEYAPPDIIVEELRIRAKINFQARPRTCRDLLRDFSNHTKSRIGLSSSRDQRIVYCCTESLIPKNETHFEVRSSTQHSNFKSIRSPNNVKFQKKTFSSETTDLSNRKIIFNDTENNDIQRVHFNGKSNEKDAFSSWNKEKNRRIGSNEEFVQNADFHRKSRADLMENKTTSFRQFHRTSTSHWEFNSSKKKNAGYSGTKREEIGRESKAHFFHKPKRLITLNTFDDKLDENFRWNEKPEFRDIESPDNEVETGNTKSLRFFGDNKIAETENNEFEKPGLLSVFSGFEKKLHKRSTTNIQTVQPCHRKSMKNVTSYSTALRLKKREPGIGNSMVASHSGDRETIYMENEQLLISHNFRKKSDSISKGSDKSGSHRRDRRSLEAPNNSTTALNNNNQKKVPKKSANSNKKKKPKTENSTKKPQFEFPKSLPSEIRNATKTKINLEILSNNSMWNFTVPPTFTKYFTLFPTLFRPLFENYPTNNKNQSTLVRENIKKNNLSNVREEKVKNSTEIRLPSSTEILFPNLTENNRTLFTESSGPSSIKNSVSTSIVTNFPILPKTSGEAMGDADVQGSMKLGLKKPRNNAAIYLHEKFATAKVNNSNVTDSLTSTTEFVSKDFAKNSISPIYQTTGPLSKTEKNISETWNSSLKDNDGKLSEVEMSVIKMIANPTENLTKISSEATSDKPEDFHGETTLNFTIIDTNCTDSLLLNSLPNNSANHSSNIAEVMSQMSTYPTLRRYSRNDSVDEAAGPNINVLEVRNNDAKNRQTKNSLNDLSPSNVVRKGHGGLGNHGRKRSRYKGKVQHPFVTNLLPRVGKQPWRRINGSVILISSIPSSSSTLPTGISGSSDSSGNGRSSASPVLGDLPKLSPPTVTPFFDWQQIQISTNTSTVKPDSRDDLTQTANTLPHNEESSISASTKISMNEIPRQIGSTPDGYKFFEKKELKSSTPSSETSAELNFVNFSPSNEIQTKPIFSARESKPDETVVINEILTKTLIDFSTAPYDKSISVDPLMITKTDNSIIPKDSVGHDFGGKEEIRKMEEIKKNEVTQSATILETPITLQTILPVESQQGHERIIMNNTITDETSTFSNDELNVTDSSIINKIELPTRKNTEVSESSSKKGNEILPDRVNTLSTLDEAIERDFVPGSAKKQILLNSTPEIGSTESVEAKRLIAFNHSTSPPNKGVEKVDQKYPGSTTEFYFRMRNKEDKKLREEHFTRKLESSTASEVIEPFNSSVTPKDISPEVSSLNYENSTGVDFTSITRNPDFKRQGFSSKIESVIDVPTTLASAMKMKTIEKKTLAAVSLPRTARRARDTGTLSEYEETQEPELDYDIDGLGGTEMVTEATGKMGEDTSKGLGGTSITKNAPFATSLPHSAVHGIFFEDGKASEDSESTVIPGINQIRDGQSLPVSTTESLNRLNLSNEFSDNLTNFLDESEILAFVKSLEEFLFDDSATGTSNRKQLLLRDQDLVAEPSNRNFETRSAIFKTKKFSVVNKKIGKNANKVDATRNLNKTKPSHSAKSTTKTSSGKRIRPKIVDGKIRKTKIDTENEKMKKEKNKISLKARKAKISKRQLAFNNWRGNGNVQDSTDRISANKRKSNVNKK